MLKSEALDCLLNFDENDDMDFVECYNGYNQMQKIVEEYPEFSGYVLSTIVNSSSKKIFCSDLAPTAMRLFDKAVANVTSDEAEQQFKRLFDKNTRFALQCVSGLLKEKPELSETTFEQISKASEKSDNNNAYAYTTALVATINSEKISRASEMLNEVMQNPKLSKNLYGSLYKIYSQHPEMGQQILSLLDSPQHLTAEQYSFFYKNLSAIAARNAEADENTAYIDSFQDKAVVNQIFDLMEKHIGDKEQTSESLTAVYNAAGQMLTDFPKHKDRIEGFVKEGLKHPKNNAYTNKAAYRVLGDYEKLCSKVSFYRRGGITETNPYGLSKAEGVGVGRPCVLVFGGDGVRTEKAINGYLGEVYRLLKDNGLEKNIDVYGVVYDFGDYMNANFSRTKMMENHHRRVQIKKELSPETLQPKYIKDIFDKMFLPRISENGKKIEAAEAARNIRKLNIVAHCHGAYTALMLEEMMQNKMKELGYNKQESENIQRQLLVVSQSPYCPLGDSKSTFVSFASAMDTETQHYNNFEMALQAIRKEEKIPFSYFPDKRGNLFLAGTMGRGEDEHNFWGFKHKESMDKQGQALLLFERKVLLNGVKNSLTPEKGIPTVRELAVDDQVSADLFAKAEENGKHLYNKMYALSMAVAQYRAKNRE